MTVLSTGDLARTFQTHQLTTSIKNDLARLSKELATGIKSDLGATLAGDFGPYAGIERSLKALTAYSTANSEATGMFDAVQLALDNVQSVGQSLSPGLLVASSSRDATLISASADDARQKLEIVVSSFNTRVADRALFGGAATDRTPLASATEIMDELKLAITAAGAATATDIATVVDDWFDTPGGGFETTGYLGSTSDMGPLIVAEGETVSVDLRADDQVMRDAMKGFALAGLIAEGALSGNVNEQADLVSIAAQRLLSSDGDLTLTRAHVGAQEARIEDAKARNSAEQAAYELSRAELITADPYQTASEFQSVYSQLETLYTATARISSLKFTDYMR